MESHHLLDTEETTLQQSPQTAFTIGRTTGIILLLQLATALTLPFIISKPITAGTPAFLTAVAEHLFQIRLAVFISFIGAAMTVYLGITMFRIFRFYSISVAILFVVVCAVSCILDLVQAGTIMSMIAISNQFVSTDTANSELFQVVGAAVASTRRSSHIVQLLAIGAWMFIFYISLLRFKLIPRVLALIGVIGVMSQFTGVTLMMFLGIPTIGQMAMPLLPIQIIVGVWLIIKGFNNNTLKSMVSDIR